MLEQKIKMGVTALKYKCFGTKTPLLVSLSITGKCNLHCPYCYINIYKRKMTEPTLTELKKQIDNFYKLGTRIFFLQGGEPMIRKDIVELTKYVKSKGCYVSITSNGTINHFIPKLKGIVDHIEFSLDGPPEVNDKTRGPGVFNRTLESARIAQENGIKFHFHCVLNKYNSSKKQLLFLSNLATNMNTFFTACFATSSGFDNNPEFIGEVLDDTQKKVYRLLIKMKEEGHPLGVSNFALKHALNWPLKYSQIGDKTNLPKGYKQQCVHGRLAAWVDHDGWIYPCTRAFGREEYRENIKKLGVKNAWEKLSSKISCVDCGVASDITSIFNFNLESVLDVLKNKY